MPGQDWSQAEPPECGNGYEEENEYTDYDFDYDLYVESEIEKAEKEYEERIENDPTYGPNIKLKE